MGNRIAWLLAAFMTASGLAYAHGLEIYATGNGATIKGSITYDDHEPAEQATIQVKNAAGELLTSVVASETGEFEFQALGSFDHHLETETADGHRAEHVVPAAEVGGAAAPADEAHAHPPATAESRDDHHGPDAAELEAIVARQVQPLREELYDYKRSVAMRDIIGGIGYIVGVLGIIGYFKARRQPSSA